MADFSDVVKELKQTNSKLDKMVEAADPSGPVMAGESEKVREEETRENKQTSLLERIAKAVEGGLGGSGDKKVGKNLMIFGAIPGIIGTMLKGLGIGALVGAGVYSAFLAFKDGLAGMDWAKEMGMEAETGFISGFLGGKKGAKGWMNAAFQGMKGFAMGATAGLPFGPLGVVVGALIGGALFGIAGFFGAEAIADLVDPIVVKVKTFLGMSVNLTAEEKKSAEAQAIELTAIAKTRREEADIISKKLETALAAGADQAIIDKLIIAKAKAERLALTAAKVAKEAQEQVLVNERQAEKNALNAAEAAVSRNAMEVMRLKNQERRLQSAITMHGADTAEGKTAAAELAVVRVELREKVAEGKKLREDEVKAEEVLLAEDRRLLKAADKNISAPWKARLNVWTADFPDMISKNWDKFTSSIPQWIKNNIFDPGSADPGGLGQGTPMKIFGFELKFPKIDISLPTKEELVAMLPKWMTDFELPKLEDFTMPDFNLKENWDKFTSSIPQWIKNYIFDPGSTDPGGLGQGTPMKIFGMELKFPSLNINFSGMADKIMALLPKWLTDPVGYIKDMVKWFPKLGKSDAEKAAVEKANLEEARAALTKKAGSKTGLEGLSTKELKDMFNDISAAATGGGTEAQQAQMAVLAQEIKKRPKGKQFGGSMNPGDLAIVGEGGRELFMSDRAGTILSAGLTRQMLGGMGNGGTNIINAPSVVNAPQTNMSMVGAPIVNDNPILRAINASAFT